MVGHLRACGHHGEVNKGRLVKRHQPANRLVVLTALLRCRSSRARPMSVFEAHKLPR